MVRDPDAPSFSIPTRPERRFPYEGGVEYEGKTVFTLRPDTEYAETDLQALVEATLAAGPYRYGDFFDLPMPLYLVRDEDTADVFRISVRDGCLRLHVLPATESDGLRAFYDRLVERTETDWDVVCDAGR
mgnify:CR=1 FL=1|jgi:hypothetical protein